MRRGAVLRMLGRREEALAALGSAIPGLRAEGDSVWEARALGNRALVHLEFGSPARAAKDLERCCALFADADQGIEAAGAVHIMGWAAYRSGALGPALRSLDEAERRYLDLGVRLPQVAMDRCAVLLAAGLFEEAFQEIDACVKSFSAGASRSDLRADAALMAARAALAAGRPGDAIRHATLAERLYVRHDNARAVALARLEGVRARAARVDARSAAALARRAALVADELDGSGSPEAVGAALLAGRAAAAAGDRETALAQWRRAAAGRRAGTALDRVSGWLAVMLSAELGGSRSGVLAAAESGMRVLDTHRLSLGATELRAYATEHGRELADGALRQVVDRGDAWALLRWTERWRATVIDVPVSRPATDPELVASLGALREVQRELTHGADGTHALQTRRAQLERAVLDRSRQVLVSPTQQASPVPSRGPSYARGVTETLGPHHRLVSLVDVSGTLHAVVVADGVARRCVVGPIEAAARESGLARFALRAALSGRSRASTESLASTGRLLQAALLGPAADLIDVPDGRTVVLVPPARLQGTPWGLLPVLAERPFGVTPSGRSWARAAAAKPPTRRTVVLAHGPGLDSTGEIPELIGLHPKATVLGDGTATAEAVLREIDGAWLVHLAAHGRFRGDNPLFSALHLDDGDLTVHDLEQLKRAPYRLVLSACDVGLAASVGTDELLGVVGALLMLGSAGVVASLMPVPDGVVAGLSVELHERYLAGATSAEALCGVRAARDGDLIDRATAASFLAFGAA